MVIFNCFSVLGAAPKFTAVRTRVNSAARTKNITAIPRYPMPKARPRAMAVKIAAISLAVPGTLRKRTRAKAPATATPVPMLPFTSMITTATAMGRRARVRAKLALCRLLYRNTAAVSTPRIMASARQISRDGRVMGVSIILFNMSVSSLSLISAEECRSGSRFRIWKSWWDRSPGRLNRTPATPERRTAP